MKNYKISDPWAWKHKPLDLYRITFNSDIKKRFLYMVEKNNMPNLIIHGPPGIGKTSKKKKLSIMKLNASHARGIHTARIKIKFFCETKIDSEKMKKIVIIDEAEYLTKYTQEALRRTIENFSQTVRFIFICNYPSKIIEALQSRCVVLKFKYVLGKMNMHIFTKILYKEKVLFSIKGLESMIIFSGGDVRELLNESELVEKSFLMITSRTSKLFYFFPTIYFIDNFIYSILNQNYLNALEIFLDTYNKGHQPFDIINYIFKSLKKMSFFHFRKLKMLKILCQLQIKVFSAEIDATILFLKLKNLLTTKTLSF
nr:DNA replication factor C complex subunit Rfc2 [Cryptomonas paramecium]